ASRVTMLVRGPSLALEMSQYLIDQIGNTENIEVCTHTEVVEVHGEQRLEALTLRNSETGETETVPAAALFIFIGAVPHTEMVASLVKRNKAGFILTGADMFEGDGKRSGWTL